MKILMVTLGFYPASAWGGPVKIVHQNGRELVRRGHQVTVYCTNLLDKQSKIQPGTFERQVDGMRVVYFETWYLRRWPGTLGPCWLPGLPGQIRREIDQFDVIHLHGSRNFMALPVARTARRTGVPLVVQPHGALPVIVSSFLVKRLYDRFLGDQELKGISALIALQESERQQALERGIPSELIQIIPNGLDLADRDTLPADTNFRSRFAIPPDSPMILFLGRINRKKGVDMLVEAFALMGDLNAYLAIVGPDDGQLAEVQALMHEHGLTGRVVLPGLLAGSDVMDAFRAADLFVLPCRVDTFPTTILESCLSETPMVITEGCEIADLVRDKVAEVVPFDAQAFADAMGLLLTDRERYECYRANCQSMMAEHFSLESTVNRLEALYERVITKGQVEEYAVED